MSEEISHGIHHDEVPFLTILTCLTTPAIVGAVAPVVSKVMGASMPQSPFLWPIVAMGASYIVVGGLNIALIAVERRIRAWTSRGKEPPAPYFFGSLFLDPHATHILRSPRVSLALLAAIFPMVHQLPALLPALLGGAAGVLCAWSDVGSWIRRHHTSQPKEAAHKRAVL